MSQSDKIILDNRNTIDFIVDFEQKIKEKIQFSKCLLYHFGSSSIFT